MINGILKPKKAPRGKYNGSIHRIFNIMIEIVQLDSFSAWKSVQTWSNGLLVKTGLVKQSSKRSIVWEFLQLRDYFKPSLHNPATHTYYEYKNCPELINKNTNIHYYCCEIIHKDHRADFFIYVHDEA